MKALRNFATGFGLVAFTTGFAYCAYWCLATIPVATGWEAIGWGAAGFGGIVGSVWFCWGIGTEVWREHAAEEAYIKELANLPITTMGDPCPTCGGCDYICADCAALAAKEETCTSYQ